MSILQMKSDKSIAVLAMVASLGLAIGSAAAQGVDLSSAAPEGVEITDNRTLDEFENTEQQQQTVDGGNVSEVNVSGQQTTSRWSGLYGTATGSLVLGTTDAGTENLFYEWTGAEVSNVFAYAQDVDGTGTGTFDGVNFANLTAASAANVSDAYNIPTDIADDASATYEVQHTFDLNGAASGGSLTTTAAETEGGLGSVWYTGVLQDVEDETAPVNDSDAQSNDPVFVGETVTDGSKSAFNGDEANYQMIVPADAGTPDDGQETYTLYVELQ